MTPELHAILRLVHIALGFAAFVLGALALVLPKFGATSGRHRWIGRAYALSMVGMGAMAIPLSLRNSDYFLLVIDILTLGWVVGGWRALRMARRIPSGGERGFAANHLRLHIVFMGSSYIAAWTAFLVNVHPLGTGPVRFWFYALGPTLIGTRLIARAVARYVKPPHGDMPRTERRAAVQRRLRWFMHRLPGRGADESAIAVHERPR